MFLNILSKNNDLAKKIINRKNHCYAVLPSYVRNQIPMHYAIKSETEEIVQELCALKATPVPGGCQNAETGCKIEASTGE